MRKRMISHRPQTRTKEPPRWLEVEHLAQVELTSEDPSSPIESALASTSSGPGWRAAESGPQVVRLVFDSPQRIRCIHLEFKETEQERTQEFTLRWSPDGGRSYQELVRQQYNFSPADNAREVEEYAVELEGLTALELVIIPDISRGAVKASLERLLLA